MKFLREEFIRDGRAVPAEINNNDLNMDLNSITSTKINKFDYKLSVI